jgi:P27 family predicted phage terminase small subunit
MPIKLHKSSEHHRSKAEIQARSDMVPTISQSALECPEHMCEDAKAEWRKVVELYRDLTDPIVTDLDKNALEIYCENMVIFRHAMAKMRETQEVYAPRTDPNKPRQNPWLSVANNAATICKKYGELLLLDPISRARAGLAKAKEETSSETELYFMNKVNGHGPK